MKQLLSVTLFLALAFIAEAQTQLTIFGVPIQSAAFTRMPSRETMIEIDAAMYNPANLALMEDGWHFSLNNMFIFQDNKITSNYIYFTEPDQEITYNIRSYVFPSFYLNYKEGNSSFHASTFLVGGAGGAKNDNLFLFERNIADLTASIPITDFFFSPSLTALDQETLEDTGTDPMYRNVTDYRYNYLAQGLAASPALQVGYAHKLHDMITLGLDFRFIYTFSSNKLDATDIEILAETANPDINGWQTPADYYRAIGDDSGQDYQLAVAIFDALLPDQIVEVKERAFGVSFVPSVLIKPTEDLSIAMKYESKAKLDLKTTVIDGKDGGVFVNDSIRRGDIPAILSGGVGYQINDKWRVNTGFRYHFFKQADYNGKEAFVNGNPWDIELAASYQMNDKLLLSAGYTRNSYNMAPLYQSEIQAFLTGNNIGLGFNYAFAENLSVDLGALISIVESKMHTYNDHEFAMGNALATIPQGYDNTYTQKYESPLQVVVGLGINYSLPTKSEE